jgi:hypothetical protein
MVITNTPPGHSHSAHSHHDLIDIIQAHMPAQAHNSSHRRSHDRHPVGRRSDSAPSLAAAPRRPSEARISTSQPQRPHKPGHPPRRSEAGLTRAVVEEVGVGGGAAAAMRTIDCRTANRRRPRGARRPRPPRGASIARLPKLLFRGDPPSRRRIGPARVRQSSYKVPRLAC